MEGGTPHVLVVENDPDVRDVLTNVLMTVGACHVTGAASAEEAIAALDQQRPDAAVIDAILPKMSGLTLARHFIDLGIPSLITSGDPGVQQRLTEIGCQFLAKPFRIEQLLTETKALMEEAERRMAHLKDVLGHLTGTP